MGGGMTFCSGAAEAPNRDRAPGAAGPRSASDAVVKMDSNSPACAQMKSQLAQMDPAKCAPGAGHGQCVQQMTASRAQQRAMCK
jgi:hypothetical protein